MTENKYICFSKIYYCFKFISFFFKANKKIYLFCKEKIKKIKSGQIWPNLAKTAIWPDLARFPFFFNFVKKKSKQFLVEILLVKNLDIFKFFLVWKISR